MKKYALITNEGTAIAESCICDKHCNIACMTFASMDVKDAKDSKFVDVSENDECECIFCTPS